MAKPSRRSVLRASILVPAAAVPLVAADNALSVVAGGMSSGLRRSTFTPHRKSTFQLVGDGVQYSAVLTKVDDLAQSPRGHDRKFRLLFKVSGGRPEGGTYRLRHARVAAMDLFVAPVGGDGLYEAVVDAR